MLKENCTHCHKPILCNVDNIAACDCQTVELLDESVLILHERTQHDCLWNNCLRKLDGRTPLALTNQFPNSPSALIEGVPSCIENGYFAFTQIYDYLRAACCKNKCR